MKKYNQIMVSVVVPVFNSGKTIAQCVQSFLRQTLKIHEIVIVDDGSSDDTISIIKNMAVATPNAIKIIEHRVNMGQGAARHTGALNCTGDFIVQADSDAFYSRNYVSKLVGLISRKSKAMSFGGLRKCWGPERGLWKIFWDAYFIARWKQIKDKKSVLRGAWAFRRDEYINAGGYNCALRQGEDADLVYRFCQAGFTNHWTPSVKITHVEPQKISHVFRRFVKSEDTIFIRIKNRTILKSFLGSLFIVCVTLTGAIILLTPLLIIVVPDLNIGFRVLFFREHRLGRALIYPFQYYCFRFSSAWGIVRGVRKYLTKMFKKKVRNLQNRTYYTFKERQFRKQALFDSSTVDFIPVLMSFDDFSPAPGGDNWIQLNDGSYVNPFLIKLLDEKKIRMTMFSIAAFHYNEQTWDLRKYPDWLTFIRKYSDRVEIGLHGITHHQATSSTKMVEYSGLSYEKMKQLLETSIQYWHDAGFRVHGIRPPGWGLGKHDKLIDAAAKVGLRYGSFASINDGANRIIKHASMLYPMLMKGSIINVPQNIGIWDDGIVDKVRYLIDSGGTISIKFHYGDYAYNKSHVPFDRLDAHAYNRINEILNLVDKVISNAGKKPQYCTHNEFVECCIGGGKTHA